MTIPVVLAFDPEYYFPTCVTVWSVMEQSDLKDQYCFFFLISGEASDVDKGVFDAIAEKYSNFSYKYITVGAVFANIRRTVPHISVPTYYRLLIPEVVCEYDRCIYLDSDMIVFGNITRILDECDATEGVSFNQCYLAAVRDMLMQVEELPWTKTHLDSIGFKDRQSYFNAGLLVLNLARMREDMMVDSFLELSKNGYYFCDQDVLNIACAGKIRYLPARDNLVAPYIGNRYIAERAGLQGEDWRDTMQGRPFICHFAGPGKPWERVETIWEYEWYERAKRLPQTEYVREQLRVVEENKVDRWRDDLLPMVRRAGELILYGFSAAGYRLCSHLLAEGFTNIRCFCDRDTSKIGLSHEGIPCHGREILSGLPKDAMVIICPQKSWREIYQDLIEAGVDKKKVVRFRGRDTRIVSLDQ